METQLFEWDECDDCGNSEYRFRNVTTLVPLGNIPVGTKFKSAFVSFSEEAYMELYREENYWEDVTSVKFNLSLVATPA